jgi:hypothetical protein
MSFFKKLFTVYFRQELAGKRANTIIAHYRQVIIKTNKTMLLTKQQAGV